MERAMWEDYKLHSTMASWQRVKLIILGDVAAGKSSVVRWLRGDPFVKDHIESDIGLEYVELQDWKIYKEQVENSAEHPTAQFSMGDSTQSDHREPIFHVWDCAGQERFYAIHQYFFNALAIYAIIVDVSQPMDEKWLSRVRFWIYSVRARAKTAPIVIIGTHLDAVAKPLLVAQKMKEEFGKLISQPQEVHKDVSFASVGNKEDQAVFCVSCKDDDEKKLEIRNCVNILANNMILNIGKSPATWLLLMERIFGKKCESIPAVLSIVDVRAIASECAATETDIVACLRFCHQLGLVLYFDDDLELWDIVFVHPKEVAEALSAVTTVQLQTVQAEVNYSVNNGFIQGKLTDTLLRILWRYDPAVHSMLQEVRNLRPVCANINENHPICHVPAGVVGPTGIGTSTLIRRFTGTQATAPDSCAFELTRYGAGVVSYNQIGGILVGRSELVIIQTDLQLKMLHYPRTRTHTAFISDVKYRINSSAKPFSFEVEFSNPVFFKVGVAVIDAHNPIRQVQVGGDEFSYGFDPVNGNLWHNNQQRPYGRPFSRGTIIRCEVDLEKQTISFYANEESLGVAFRNIRVSTNTYYVPCITCQRLQQIVFRSQPLHAGATSIAAGLRVDNLPEIAVQLDDADATRDHEQTALQLAVASLQVPLAKLMLEYGAPAHASDVEGYNALHVSIIAGNLELVDYLTKRYPSLVEGRTKRDETALHLCARFGRYGAMLVVLRYLNTRELINARDKDGFSALMLCAAEGYLHIVTLLVNSGADPYLTNSFACARSGEPQGPALFRTAFEEAVERGHIDCALKLKPSDSARVSQAAESVHDKYPYLAYCLGYFLQRHYSDPLVLLCKVENANEWFRVELEFGLMEELRRKVSIAMRLFTSYCIEAFFDNTTKQPISFDADIRSLSPRARLFVRLRDPFQGFSLTTKASSLASARASPAAAETTVLKGSLLTDQPNIPVAVPAFSNASLASNSKVNENCLPGCASSPSHVTASEGVAESNTSSERPLHISSVHTKVIDDSTAVCYVRAESHRGDLPGSQSQVSATTLQPRGLQRSTLFADEFIPNDAQLGKRMCVLFAEASNPPVTPSTFSGRVLREIQKIGSLNHVPGVDVVSLRVSLEEVKPTVLHIWAHGDRDEEYGIVLSDTDQLHFDVQWTVDDFVTPKQLAALIKKTDVQCVLLSVCSSNLLDTVSTEKPNVNCVGFVETVNLQYMESWCVGFYREFSECSLPVDNNSFRKCIERGFTYLREHTGLFDKDKDDESYGNFEKSMSVRLSNMQ